MAIANGVKYESNYARAAAYFLNTCAERSDNKARAAAYDLIVGIYRGIAKSPENYGLKPVPDVWFEPWEQQRDRQKDVKTIRDSIAKIDSLMADLYAIVVNSKISGNSFITNESCKKPSRLLTKALLETGAVIDGSRIVINEDCVNGLSELAEISAKNVTPITDSPIEDKFHLLFSRCVFEPSANWTAVAFDKALGADGQLVKLCEELEKRDYKRIDCKDGKRISLDYVKQFGEKETPVKMSWADKTHYGIELTYEDLRLEPYFIWLRMADFKNVLTKCSDSLPDNVVDFIVNNTKNCDGCRYCVQTDKTGTRPLAAISVGNKKKCPYYPAFSMNWRFLSTELAESMLAVLDTLY